MTKVNSGGRNSSVSSPSISTAGLLGVAFVVLKLTEVIDWAWIWVLTPFWGGIAFVLVLLLMIFGGVAIATAVTNVKLAISRKRKRSQKQKGPFVHDRNNRSPR